MFPNGLRVITSEFLKKNNRFNLNILWHNKKYAFIEINKKSIINYKDYQSNISDIPDYDKDVNPYLLPFQVKTHKD